MDHRLHGITGHRKNGQEIIDPVQLRDEGGWTLGGNIMCVVVREGGKMMYYGYIFKLEATEFAVGLSIGFNLILSTW